MQPIEIDEALEKIELAVASVPTSAASAVVSQSIALACANGRRLLESVKAPLDHPPFDQSLRDGIALRHEDGCSPRQIVKGVFAGETPELELQPGQAAKIMTGAPLPRGADCVEMIEKVQWIDKLGHPLLGADKPWSAAKLAKQVRPSSECQEGQHVLPKGSLFRKGQVLQTAGQRLNPASIGLLASTGMTHVQVCPKLNVSLLITGDEVRPGGSELRLGQIYNSNGPLLESLAERSNLDVIRSDWIGDDGEKLESWVKDSLTDSDLIITTGGVSAGEKDLLAEIFLRTGVLRHFHGVRIKPGKPIWFGQQSSPRNCFVFGLPGNPVSCQVCYSVFVQALINRVTEVKTDLHSQVAQLELDWKVNGDRTTFWPGVIADSCDFGKVTVRPLDWQGSADLVGPSFANVLIKFDPSSRESGQWRSGENVEVFTY